MLARRRGMGGRRGEGHAVITSRQFDRHLVGAVAVLAEHAGGRGWVATRDDVAIAAVGRGPDEFNAAWLLDLPDDPAASLAWACAALARRPAPFMVQVPEDLEAKVGPPLEELGLAPSHRAPGMVQAPTTDVPPPPACLRIERVRDAGALRLHAVATATGFGACDTDDAVALMPPSLLDDDRVACFNGYVDDRTTPQATGMVVVAGGIAGIHAVTTHAPVRRRGVGAAMTWAAVAAGSRPGVAAVVLQASPQGRPLYERMGFRVARVHRRFRPAQDR